MEDFIGFTYNGKHCIKDFDVYRTSDGSRYNDNLVPSMTDKTADVPGGDGQYFFKTTHKNRQISVSIAFDHLTEQKYREMRNWLDGREIHDLIFDEAPYKVYSAKVTGTPQLKTICFDEYNEELEMNQRIYKGEGTIQFTCYHPYARTPEEEPHGFDGRSIDKYYERYDNYREWEYSSGITTHKDGMNPGDVPAPFILEIADTVPKNIDLIVGDLKVTILQECSNLKWDSKSGLITGDVLKEGDTKPTNMVIHYSGTSYGTIPVGGVKIEDLYLGTWKKQGEGVEEVVFYEHICINKTIYTQKLTNGELGEPKKEKEKADSPPFTLTYNYWYY